jgi:glycine/D-amino acid oxidase-like deaminating enzyme
VIATNGYTGDLIPKLRQTVIRPNSFIVATEPLSDNLAGTILPEGQVTSDTRQLLLYFRKDHDNRLLMGGRGPFREPREAADWAHLERVVAKMFPQAKGLRFDYRWCGRVALTRDFLPHLHEPEPGLLVDIGCMGRGVGLQSAMGKAMAEYLTTGDKARLPFPVTPITPLPLHALNELYVSAIIAWYRLTDGGMKDRAA